MLHGGKIFTSGNDLSVFADPKFQGDPKKLAHLTNYGLKTGLVNMLLAMARSVKPIVAVVRGFSVGIGFTMLGHATFIYCSPEAFFKAPFMASAQSAEGTSTLLFP